MTKSNADEIKQEIIALYSELKSSYKVANAFGVSATAVKRILKDARVLRTQKQAAKERDNSYCGTYQRTEEHKQNLSKHASQRVGEKNPFFGKKHTDEVKRKLSSLAKLKLGELNPNYLTGEYLRRPRDFKIAEFTKLRNFVFNRDSHTCVISGIKGGHLHAHHLLPFWVCPEAFLDTDNLITVSTKTHFEICHKGSWGSFNIDLIPESLSSKYNLSRERLNELASYFKKMR